MSSGRADPDARKRQILEAAMTVFARKGFDGASMGEIVRESGISKGGLYWHFKSKDEIIAAILRQFFDQEMADTEAIVSRDGPAVERLLRLTDHLANEMEKAFGLLPISLEFYAVAARQESVRAFLQDYYDSYQATLQGLVAEGIETGAFRPVDVGDATTTIIATFEGLILLWAIHPEGIDLKEQSEAAIRLLLDGLRAED